MSQATTAMNINIQKKYTVQLSVRETVLFFQLPICTDDEWFICSIHVALILNEIEEVACRWLLYLHQCFLQIDMNSIEKNLLTIEHLCINSTQMKPIYNIHFKSFMINYTHQMNSLQYTNNIAIMNHI